MTGDTGGKRLWNESAGYFIYHIHSISQSGAVNQGPHFDSKGSQGREKWDTARWLTVTARLFQLSPNQFEESGVYKMDYYRSDPKRHRLPLLAEEVALSMCGEEK